MTKKDEVKGLTVIPRTLELYVNGEKINECPVPDEWPDVDDMEPNFVNPYDCYKKCVKEYEDKGYRFVSGIMSQYSVLVNEKEMKSVCVAVKMRFDVKDAHGKPVYDNSVLQYISQYNCGEGNRYMLNRDYYSHIWKYTKIDHYCGRLPQEHPIESLDWFKKVEVVR